MLKWPYFLVVISSRFVYDRVFEIKDKHSACSREIETLCVPRPLSLFLEGIEGHQGMAVISIISDIIGGFARKIFVHPTWR